VGNEHLQAFENGVWKPWCKCTEVPLKVPADSDMVLCMTPYRPMEYYVGVLDALGIPARVVKTACSRV
jgi:hypothetical protein